MIEIGKLYRMTVTELDPPSNSMAFLVIKGKDWVWYPVQDTHFVVLEGEEEGYKLLMPDGNIVKCFAAERRYIPVK